jgi:hypothetical protein
MINAIFAANLFHGWRRWIEKMGRERRFFSQSSLNQMTCGRDKRVGSE